MMEMELPGKRKRGRPKRRFLDVVKEDIREVGAKETDVEDRTVWRKIIRCDYPERRERPKREEETNKFKPCAHLSDVRQSHMGPPVANERYFY